MLSRNECEQLGQIVLPNMADIISRQMYTIVLATGFSLIICLVIFTNVVVIVSIIKSMYSDRYLRKQNNFSKSLMVSMAIADLLLGVLPMSLEVHQTAQNGEQFMGSNLCSMKQLTDLYLCIVSINHVTFMAVDRYLAVCRPLLYRTLQMRTAYLMVCTSWFIPAVEVFFPMIWDPLRLREENVNACSALVNMCLYNINLTYHMVFGITSIFIPLFVIFLLYFVILRAIRHFHKRKIKLGVRYATNFKQDLVTAVGNKYGDSKLPDNLATSSNAPNHATTTRIRQAKSMYADNLGTGSGHFDTTSKVDLKLTMVFSDEPSASTSSQPLALSFLAASMLELPSPSITPVTTVTQNRSWDLDNENVIAEPIVSNKEGDLDHLSAFRRESYTLDPNKRLQSFSDDAKHDKKSNIQNTSNGLSLKRKFDQRSSKNTDLYLSKLQRSDAVLKAPTRHNIKVVKTVGSIIVCFTLCWLPTGVSVIVAPLLHTSPPHWVVILIAMLAYSNSALNPFLYCTNKSIRRDVLMTIRPFRWCRN